MKSLTSSFFYEKLSDSLNYVPKDNDWKAVREIAFSPE